MPLLAVLVAAALAGCTAAPSGPVAATVTVAGLNPADSTRITASGTVTGIAENDGRCIFTFWASSGAATRLSGPGKAAGDHVACGPVDEEVGFLVGGTYSVELKYQPVAGDPVTSERYPMTLPTPSDLNP